MQSKAIFLFVAKTLKKLHQTDFNLNSKLFHNWSRLKFVFDLNASLIFMLCW